MNGYAYDPAEKQPRQAPAPVAQAAPSAPSFDSPMLRPANSSSVQYPYQPMREPSSSSMLYHAQPVGGHNMQQPTYHQQQPAMPPLAPLPVHPSTDYFQQQQQPLPKYTATTEPYVRRYSDTPEEESAIQAFLFETARLALFHALNAVLGYVAFTVCVGGVGTAVATLPLCCFGIVVFRIVLYAVYGFAQLDVMLYNLITPSEDHIFVSVPPNPRAVNLTGQRLAPSLSSFSPLSLMALIYFCTVKFALSTLSTICFSLAITAPLSLVCAVLGIGTSDSFQYSLGPEDVVDFRTNPLLFIMVAMCLFAIGVALMHIVARASREATTFFCCEQFSTYRYVHHHNDPRDQFYPVATTGGGGSGGVAPPASYGAFTTNNAAPAAVPAPANGQGVNSYYNGGL